MFHFDLVVAFFGSLSILRGVVSVVAPFDGYSSSD